MPSISRIAWTLVIVFYFLGDIITTQIGLQIPGVVESNPGAQAILGLAGFEGMIIAKIAVISVAYFFYTSDLFDQVTGAGRSVIPLILAIMGIAIVTQNMNAILTALGHTAVFPSVNF